MLARVLYTRASTCVYARARPLLAKMRPGAAAGGMGIDTLGAVAIYQQLVVVRAMKKLWEDLTVFYGNELIVGD